MPEERRVSPAIVIAGGLGLGIAAAVGVFALTLAAPPTPPPGRANLYGKVTDVVTGEPMSDVLVTLNGMQIFTDGGGNYIFADIEPGAYTLTFEKEGYETEVR